MQEKDLTPWFVLSEQVPWEAGVYEVELGLTNNPEYQAAQLGQWWAHWDGEKFSYASVSVRHSAVNEVKAEDEDIFVKKWRGLSTNPEKPKRVVRKVNKQKTMYVVIPYDRDEEYRPVAAFDCKEVADDRAKYLSKTQKGCFNSLKYMVHTTRFRTPE